MSSVSLLARLSRADEGVGGAEGGRDLLTGDGRLDPNPRRELGRFGDRALQLGPVRELVVGQRGPAELELRVEARLHGQAQRSERRRVALPARHPAEREQPQTPLPAIVVAGREALDVDRVAGRVQLRRLERERAPVDAEHDVREARGGAERASGVPVRVPEEERHASRLRERREQDEEERHHVDERGVGAARDLAARRSRETQASPDPGPRAEGRELDIRRQVVAPDRAAQDADRLEAAGESADEVDRLREGGMVGVDRLRDDEEPHQRAVPATVASASSRSFAARSSGVECQST